MSSIVLFQKEYGVLPGNIPAREVCVLKSDVPIAKVELEGISKLRFGYQGYLIRFNNLPPTHMITTACEEAVRAKLCFKLPRIDAPQVAKSPKVKQRYRSPKNVILPQLD